MSAKVTPASSGANIGVPTSTQVAFYIRDTMYLERMNIISDEGAGILCATDFTIGDVMPVIFHLSSAQRPIRCKGQVLDNLATTPAGLELKKAKGDKAMPSIVSAGISDSATAIFRMSDLEKPKPVPSTQESKAAQSAKNSARMLKGFCLQFLALDTEDTQLIRAHLTHSRHLAARLAAQGGASVRDSRLAIAQTFEDGDLSKRALDW